MSEGVRVGFFSRLRWGPGSTALVLGLTAVAVALLAEGISRRDYIEVFSGGVLAVVDLIIVVAKGLENIVPMRPPPEDVVGRRGVVVMAVRPPRPGVVKVGYELWSAVSDVEIPEGTPVEVVEREGIYVRVRPANK